MKNKRLKIISIIGFAAIAGVFALQLYWLSKAFEQEQDRLDEDIHIALLEVVKQLYRDQPLPQNNPVKRISADYYAVNTEAEIDASLLEYFLRVELARRAVNLDFEYAIYNCYSNEMVYGSYVSISGNDAPASVYFPKLDDYVYYFAVRFPGRSQFVASSLSEWILLTLLLLLVMGIYLYSVFAYLRQNRYSAMQRDFINTMAHEFKTPLSSIRLAAAYLSEQPQILNDERASKYSSALLKSSDRLNAEVERILELSVVESDQMPLNIEPLNVQEVLDEVIQSIELNYPEVKVNAQMPASNFNLSADEAHFKNVLFNLMDNAAKYGGGLVGVSIEWVANKIVLAVTDNGSGIPKSERKRVLGKFYRMSNRTTAKGFGLGLYYVFQVAKAHGWDIEIADASGGGARVSIHISER